MALLKRVLSNEALTLILAIFIFALCYFAWSGDLVTFLKGLGVCAALWGGVGLATLSILIEEKKIEVEPGFVRALVIMFFMVLFGPFAHRLSP